MPNYKGKRPGTRRIVVWLKGKPLEKVIRGSKTDGARFEATWRLELEAQTHDTRVAPRFEKLCVEKYNPNAKGRLAKSTWRARSNIIVSLVDFFGEKKTTEITTADTDEYRKLRLRESDLGPKSMNTELRTLVYVLRWAKERGYPVAIPKVTYAKEPKGRVRVWNAEQIGKLLETARVHDPRLLPVLVFLVNTGCRKGESIAAEWSWMSFERGMVSIPATEFWKPKSGRAREVPMSDAVRAVLSGPRRSDRWVFPNRDLGRFAMFPDARFKELQDKAGLKGGIHTLRHTYASTFLQAQPDLFLLAQVLGHSHQRITEIYAHLLPEHLERARNAVNFAPRTMATTMAEKPRSA